MEKATAVSTSNEDTFRVNRIESTLREMGEGKRTTNLHTKIRRLLKKYKERKAYVQERKLEWEKINQQRPNSEINHPDDVQAIVEAEHTIGDYKLKLDEDFVPPEEEDCSNGLLAKMQEILSVQERIYLIKKTYNDQVFDLREQKKDLLKNIKDSIKKLMLIHEELPVELRLRMVDYKDFDRDVEFPERFIGAIELPEDDHKDKAVDENVGGDMVNHFSRFSGLTEGTEIEIELQRERIREKSLEQDLLLQNANKEIEVFDAQLKSVRDQKLTVEMDALFLETFLLTLQKEYTIIQGYHKEELRLAALVDEKRIENGQFLSKILTQESALEICKKNLDLFRNERKQLQNTFDSNCLENKFSDFLKWIFEKGEEDVELMDTASLSSNKPSTSSLTSSSRDEMSAASINSSNYDETFCPRGCDPELYRLVFSLRQSKFQLNRKISDENQVYERVKGDLEFLTKEIKEIQHEKAKREEEYLKLRVKARFINVQWMRLVLYF